MTWHFIRLYSKFLFDFYLQVMQVHSLSTYNTGYGASPYHYIAKGLWF